MAKKLILIAGASASGKTRYAKYLGRQIAIPLISKDILRKVIYENLPSDISSISKNQQLGACAYSVLFYFTEILMKSNCDFVLESNFTKESEPILQSLINSYGYSCMTVLFDAPLEILHQRFISREHTEERHIGLSKGLYNDFENFRKVAVNSQIFSIGKILKVNVQDFNCVDYVKITKEITSFLEISN